MRYFLESTLSTVTGTKSNSVNMIHGTYAGPIRLSGADKFLAPCDITAVLQSQPTHNPLCGDTVNKPTSLLACKSLAQDLHST